MWSFPLLGLASIQCFANSDAQWGAAPPLQGMVRLGLSLECSWMSWVPSHRELSVEPCPLGLPPMAEGRLGLCSRGCALSVCVDVNSRLQSNTVSKNTRLFFFYFVPITPGAEGKCLLTAVPHPVSYRKEKYFCFGALLCLLLVLENIFCDALLYFLSNFPFEWIYSVLSMAFLVVASTPQAPLQLPGLECCPSSHSANVFFLFTHFWPEFAWQPATK